ncbi:MAG: hypothetical protein AAF138_11010 [Planctomycetota bacterium]
MRRLLPIAFGASVAAHAAGLLAWSWLSAPAAPPPLANTAEAIEFTLSLDAAPLLAETESPAEPIASQPAPSEPTPTARAAEPSAPEPFAPPPLEPEPEPPPPPDLAELAEAFATPNAERTPPPQPSAIPAAIPAPETDEGVRTGRRVVFVLDAAGSTAPVFAEMLRQTESLVDRLGDTDVFTITLARSGSNTADRAFQGGRLLEATPQRRDAARRWLTQLRPFGRPDPLAGLEPALGLRPDVVVYLARAIPRTPEAGARISPRPGLDHAELLGALDRLNPRDPRTGRRAAAIHAVQFAEDDPTGLMRAIAHDHGLGPTSYRVLSVEPEPGPQRLPPARQP